MLDNITYDYLIENDIDIDIATKYTEILHHINTLINIGIFTNIEESYILEDDLLSLQDSEDITTSYIVLEIKNRLKDFIIRYLTIQGITIDSNVSLTDIISFLSTTVNIINDKICLTCDTEDLYTSYLNILKEYDPLETDYGFFIIDISETLINKIQSYIDIQPNVVEDTMYTYSINILKSFINKDPIFMSTIVANDILDNNLPNVIDSKYFNKVYKESDSIDILPYDMFLLYYLSKKNILEELDNIDYSTFKVLENNTFNIRITKDKIKYLSELIGVK